jgi:hypothetical protein
MAAIFKAYFIRRYKMNKKHVSLLAGICLLSGIHQAQALPALLINYDNLLTAFTQAHEVKAVIDFNQCVNTTATSSNSLKINPGVVAGMNLSYFLSAISPDTGAPMIVSSHDVLYQSSTAGLVRMFAKLTTLIDGTVQVHNSLLDPVKMTELAVLDYSCHISNGHDKYGVKFYDVSV